MATILRSKTATIQWPGYDSKLSHGEAPVLELLGMGVIVNCHYSQWNYFKCPIDESNRTVRPFYSGLLLLFLVIFQTSFGWWCCIGVWITASALRSPELFLVFWLFLRMLKSGCSQLVIRFLSLFTSLSNPLRTFPCAPSTTFLNRYVHVPYFFIIHCPCIITYFILFKFCGTLGQHYYYYYYDYYYYYWCCYLIAIDECKY